MTQTTTPSKPRQLLKRLRDAMASSTSAQARLNQVVRIIAADMVAEVCSIYIRRAGEVLELFATEGLNPTAVHHTRLRVGEGLIGEIAAHARPLNLSDAQSHPAFAYRPETGEEIYHSLVGVPILRGGRVVGVLAVQNRSRRHYTEEEAEAIETIAMVIAEMVVSGELVNPEEMLPIDGIGVLPLRLEGLQLNDGVAIGAAVLHQPRIPIHKMIAEDPEVELGRLESAVNNLHQSLDNLLDGFDVAGEYRDVLEAFRMIAEDRGWFNRIREAIRSGLTAEAAVRKAQDDIRARMGLVSDSYLRERIHDFEELTNRLLRHLSGEASMPFETTLPANTILLARNLGPAELLDYERAKLKGLVIEEGSPNSHVSIVARALDIPVVGRVANLLDQVEPLDPVIVDGDNAVVLIRPAEDAQQTFEESKQARNRRLRFYQGLRNKPAVTRDGVQIGLFLNAGLLLDLQHLEESGVDGIGLYRTEIPYMIRHSFPDLRDQIELYRRILDRAGKKPVYFRTLDIGGDKLLPYIDEPDEENPALGWRSIRIALDRPAVLRHQIRAFLRAAAGRELNLMFPMIAEVAEFDAARNILDLEIERERAKGETLPRVIRVGTMLEVPALLWQLKALLRRVDFLSVGSNDLLQFMFASDRGNQHLAGRYDVLSPGVLTFLHSLVEQCNKANIPLSLCGEMASRPLEAMALIGIGLRSLSVAPTTIGPVKAMIRSLDMAPLRDYIGTLCDLSDHSLRDRLRNFAQDHGVQL
jgi:phosphotransferase system enzyme I (PtsP)